MQISASVEKPIRWLLLLIIVCLGSNYLIRYWTRLPKPEPGQKAEIKTGPAPNEAQFHGEMDAGSQAFRSGDYSDALGHYLSAEQTAEVLTSEQYDFLKNARLQIAGIFEQGSESAATQKLYGALGDCALRQGQVLFRLKQYEESIARAQDSEEFSSHLGDSRSQMLQSSIFLSVEALKALYRYPEAVEANQRMIDYLNAAPGDNDAALAASYQNLASIYMDAKDWPNSQQTLTQLIERYDRSLAEFPSKQQLDRNSPLVNPMIISRNWAQYNLVIVYHLGGDTDTALAKADDYYSDLSSHPPDPFHPVVYHAQDFASIALRIAIEAKRDEAIEHWRSRGGISYGNINVIALHPPNQR